MREVGISHVRIGEFAWSRLEPEEGRYDFDWLARAIETLHEAGPAGRAGHAHGDAAALARE